DPGAVRRLRVPGRDELVERKEARRRGGPGTGLVHAGAVDAVAVDVRERVGVRERAEASRGQRESHVPEDRTAQGRVGGAEGEGLVVHGERLGGDRGGRTHEGEAQGGGDGDEYAGSHVDDRNAVDRPWLACGACAGTF